MNIHIDPAASARPAARPATRRMPAAAKLITPQSLARQMLADADGDMNEATDAMLSYLEKHPRLVDEVLKIGVRKLMNELPTMERAAMTRERCAIESARPFVKAPHRMDAGTLKAQERIRRLGGHARSALMNFPYTIGGVVKPLREWTGSEILTHGETELVKGSTAVRNARFLVSVGQAAGVKKIGEALKDADIERLKAEAEALPV